MRRQGQSYYAGLLSAAQYHGAAHHRPQEFQIMLPKARRPIHCGKVRVAFIVRKRLKDVPVQNFNMPRGVILVSTAEATAVDLSGITIMSAASIRWQRFFQNSQSRSTRES
jgi:hypothetical protein